MSVHLKKLSVGSISIDNLRSWHYRAVAQGRPIIHPTRNWPRRADELLDGGCIYWIIKGQMMVRQPIADMIEVKREDGRPACGIVLEPKLIPIWPRRVRIFQGWRYLEVADAPEDLPQTSDSEPMPTELASELRELGLL
ncbi:MAG: DUF1489 domain-containing protein [Alphaproteobacteria bacterium]|nr:DUF1489 domain-containing protein [Alphaproteobacteria bacterium]MBL6777598.1 DUF1489 domain-containing protein [Alphaproteobacteria bacterium]